MSIEIPTIVILLVIPAIIGLIDMLKAVGLPSKAAGPVAVVIGVAALVAYTLWGESELFANVMIGVLIGLGAAGFYDLAKLTGTPAAVSAEVAHRHATDAAADRADILRATEQG